MTYSNGNGNGKHKVEFSQNFPTLRNLWAEIKARRVILSSREGNTWINLPLWVVIALTFITTEVVVLFLIVALVRQGTVELVRTNDAPQTTDEPNAVLV